MIAGVIRLAAVTACLVVAVGFLLFALDSGGGASQRQQQEISAPGSVPPVGQPAPVAPRDGLRGRIENLDRILLSPFAVSSTNPWVANGIPALIALLVYGFGLGFLARFIRSRA